MRYLITTMAVLFFVAACGKSVSEREVENLLEGQQEAMEKAKELEQELQDTLDERMQDL